MNERQRLLKNLHGQTIVIEGLQDALKHWSAAAHPQIDTLRGDVDVYLKRYFPQHPKLHRLLKGDYGKFGATWWPGSSLRASRMATFLSLWIFIWDDEIDADDGSLTKHLDSALAFRSVTLDYVASGLGLGPSADLNKTTTEANAIIQSFDPIAQDIMFLSNEDQRKYFLRELSFYVEKTEVEQRLRLTNRVPTFGEYWKYRLGTSAVRVLLAINELCNETNLPSQVMEDPEMAVLWDLTNEVIFMVNDLMSIKKELKEGSVENLIPILCHTLGSAQAAVDAIMHMLRQKIADFDHTASNLLSRHQANPEIQSALQAFIDGCQYYCTGNLAWSLTTDRYRVKMNVDEDCMVWEL